MDDARMHMMELSQKGYYCSQILLSLALEAQGKQDPDLIRAMAGLALGVGEGAGTCGALTGAACMIALYAGKGQDTETEMDEFRLTLAELWEWFENEACAAYGGVRCDDILRDGTPRKQRCGPIVAATYSKVMEILIEHGIDPTEPRVG
jgi:C_GCAxxG_C_C family probable redox protein